jgi:hypothetical protein
MYARSCSLPAFLIESLPLFLVFPSLINSPHSTRVHEREREREREREVPLRLIVGDPEGETLRCSEHITSNESNVLGTGERAERLKRTSSESV